MLAHSGDIRDQSLKWSKIDQNFACFWPRIFFGGVPPNFWTCIIKYTQIPIRWQSFTAIGQGNSENAWRKKKEQNITGKTEDLPLLRTGGLIIITRMVQFRGVVTALKPVRADQVRRPEPPPSPPPLRLRSPRALPAENVEILNATSCDLVHDLMLQMPI